MSTPSEETNVEPSVSRGTRGTKRKQSVVWQHMKRNENDESLATCNHCQKVLSCPGKNGTSHLLKHLRGGCRIFTLPTTSSRVATPRAQFMFDQMRSRKLLAIACIKHKYPFNIAEHDYFELFLRSLQPDFSLQCRNRLRGDVIEVYREETARLYQMLEGLDCRVSLTTDIWTSNHNDNAYMCVTCHYIDGDWKLQKKIIAFKVVNAPHTGDKLFNFLRDVILEWNLDGKLCSVVVDNASNNDVCVTLMKNWLLTDYRTLLGGELLHVRCSAHILNLIVQDGLSEIRSSIENVRDTVRYLNKSIGIKEAFDRVKRQCGLEKERELAMDVPHRWNSTYELLTTALPLKAAFTRFALSDKGYKCNPSATEWQVIENVHGLLKIFYDATNNFSGSKYPTSNLFFKDICKIHLKLIEWCNSGVLYIKNMATPMKAKFDKYWKKCNLALAIAVVLDPRCNIYYVEYFFKRIYGESALEQHMGRVRRSLDALFLAYGGVGRPLGGVLDDSGDADDRAFRTWLRTTHESSSSDKSELEIYLSEQPYRDAENFDILEWWKSNSPIRPTLSKIARDILAVPATTVASEAAFSIGGQILDESRSCLHADAVEALIVAGDLIEPAKKLERIFFGNEQSHESQAADNLSEA